MIYCPKKCPYKKDGKCSGFISAKNTDIFLHYGAQCPYYENTVLSSKPHNVL